MPRKGENSIFDFFEIFWVFPPEYQNVQMPECLEMWHKDTLVESNWDSLFWITIFVLWSKKWDQTPFTYESHESRVGMSSHFKEGHFVKRSCKPVLNGEFFPSPSPSSFRTWFLFWHLLIFRYLAVMIAYRNLKGKVWMSRNLKFAQYLRGWCRFCV